MADDSRNNADRWMTPKQAAEYTGYAVQTIYNKVSQDQIPYHKGAAGTRFLKSELDAWMRGEPVNHGSG